MSRSLTGTPRRRSAVPGQRARWLAAGWAGYARLVGAVVTAAVMSLLPVLAAPALGGTVRAGTTVAGRAATDVPVVLAITSVSPSYARAGRTITVTGWVRNISPGRIGHLAVSLTYSRSSFGSRYQLEAFARGSAVAPQRQISGTALSIARLPRGATSRWRIRLPASRLRLSCFGVYPFSAQVTGASGAVLATDPTLLPYWPSSAAACPASPRPVRDGIAWVWPLIDQPHLSACGRLIDNILAGSLGPGGRLRALLAAGLRYARRAKLTWVVDPALLDSAKLMESPYQAGGGARCGPGTSYPASQAARSWLSGLIRGTAGEPTFATPYADVDVAALERGGLLQDLALAFTQGRQIAGADLRRAVASTLTGPASAAGLLDSVAWPADGVANYFALETLAANQVRAVILDSSTMPPVASLNYTPTAVSSIANGLGGTMRVLLSDHAIGQLLASPQASSGGPAAVFAVRQLYLAETAMIAAEAPNLARAIVVAPPRRWSPQGPLADELLAATVSAPWLRPASLTSLLTGRAAHDGPPRQVPASVSPAELSARLLRHVSKLDRRVGLLEDIRADGPDPALYRAVFAIESSAWRGGAGPRARALLQAAWAYFGNQLGRDVRVFGTPGDTLGGLGGGLPISISNRLGYAVRVKVHVRVLRNAALTAGGGSITVPDGGYVTIARGQVKSIKIRIQAVNAGTTLLRISLQTPDGTPLPGKALQVKVQATHFGRLALIIGAAALAVFMITSATRAIRRGRPAAGQPAVPGSGAGGGTGPDAGAGESQHGRPGEAESPVAARPGQRPQDRPADRARPAVPRSDAAEDVAGLAPVPGRTEPD